MDNTYSIQSYLQKTPHITFDLFDILVRNCEQEWNKLYLRLLYEYGMCYQEILSLKISDIDFGNNKIFVRRNQDSKYHIPFDAARVIKFDNDIENLLVMQSDSKIYRKNNSFLFVSGPPRNGMQMGRDSVYSFTRKLSDIIGFGRLEQKFFWTGKVLSILEAGGTMRDVCRYLGSWNISKIDLNIE